MRTCVSLAALLCPLLHVVAQNDTVFANVHAEFSLAWSCKDPTNGPYIVFEEYWFLAEPDTLIDGLVWGGVYNGMEMGKLAVDGQRILYRSTDGTYAAPGSTVVLYDFGLQVGDTAYWDDYYGFGHTVVTDIDTVLLAARERKRFTLDNGDRWVQGLGSSMGLFRPLYTTPLGCGDPVVTMCADYIDVDHVPYTICTQDLLGSTEVGAGPALSIRPNPSTGVLAIHGGRGGEPFTITDVQGRTIRSGTLAAERTAVDLHSRPGVYVLRVPGSTHRFVVE